MKSLHMALTAAMLTLGVAVTTAAPAGSSPLAYAPADSEIIISANLRGVIDSKLFQRMLKQKEGEKLDAQLQIVKNLVGANPLKDLDSACVWGRVDQKETIVLVVQGRFNKDALISLVKANDQYSTSVVQGFTVHQWFDDNEKRMKYGVFLDEGDVAIFNSVDTVEKCLATKAANSGFLTSPKASLIPAGSDDAAAWALLIKRDAANGDATRAMKVQPSSASAVITLTDTAIETRLVVSADSQPHAQDWLDIAKGLLAVCRLQEDNAQLRQIAESAKVSAEATGNAVAVQITVPVP
jgi:hypothetical protein